ncbi:MAG: efflux RND transporter periplasmic adaptor subunit [Chthoniobacteraceae bacterium]
MKKIVILLVIVVIGAAAWLSLSGKLQAQKSEESDGPATFARVEKRDISFSIEVSGDIEPEFTIEVKSEVGGKLKALHVEPGQVVKQGDLLAEIDDRDLLTEKESAITEIEGTKLTLEKSRKNFERGKELFEGKLISDEVFDNLSAEYALAQNSTVRAERKLQLVEDKLRKTKVLAAADGTILKVPVIEGQVVIGAASVNNGTTLMELADLSKLLVVTHINQVDVARITMNQRVKLRVESLPDEDLEAEVTEIALVAAIKNNVKGFEVKAMIDKPSSKLRPGMTVNMTVPIAKASDVVSVPIAAVFKGDGRSKVVYVRNGDAAEKREVKVGITDINFAQIEKGLTEGEEILLTEPPRPDGPGGGPGRGPGGPRGARSAS